MRQGRWPGFLLIALGVAVGACALLGPFALEVLDYRTSHTMLNQVIGGDAAALFVVAPVAIVAGILVLRQHPAGPVLALAPSIFGVYTYTQLIVGNEYLRLPGNVERFFPLLLTTFILAGASALSAWRLVDQAALPPSSRRADRFAAIGLLFIVAFIVLGLHLSSYLDAVSDTPRRNEYLSSPTPFWLVKLMDLGIIVPIAIAVAVGLLRRRAWARTPAYALFGGYALLGTSVAGMAITMKLNDDPDASVGVLVGAVIMAGLLIALAYARFRPLFAARRS